MCGHLWRRTESSCEHNTDLLSPFSLIWQTKDTVKVAGMLNNISVHFEFCFSTFYECRSSVYSSFSSNCSEKYLSSKIFHNVDSLIAESVWCWPAYGELLELLHWKQPSWEKWQWTKTVKLQTVKNSGRTLHGSGKLSGNAELGDTCTVCSSLPASL